MNDAQTKWSKTPFIIWTMQRTGGTNFTRNLIDLSKLRAQHEPFNRPRVYGEVTKAWGRNRDKEAVAAAISDILDKPHVIKHCVEMVPWRISAELARLSAEKGYKSVFLIRQSSVQRLLSMEYAQRTKVWGPSHDKPDELTDGAFDKPLDVQALFDHEHVGIERLNDFWKRLKNAKVKPASISFETLYEAPMAEACTAVCGVLDALEMRGETDVEALVAGLRNRGNQQTRDRYSRFSGLDALTEQLTKLPAYTFT